MARKSATQTPETIVEEEIDTVTAPTREVLSGERPSHLLNVGGNGGPGRARIETEFDDVVLEWYNDNDWKGIPASGNDDDERRADFEEIYKAVKRAADHHQLGIERARDEENFTVWVNIRDKQKRGPRPGSIKDHSTGKMVRPDDPRYDEVKAARENGTNTVDSVSNGDNEDDSDF